MGWGSAGVGLTASEEAELAAARLAHWLSDGHVLPDIEPSLPELAWFNLDPAEGCKYQTNAQCYVYSGADVTYNRGFFLAGGSAGMVAGSLAASALYNHHQRKTAQAQAAAQWRNIGAHTLFFTSARIVAAGSQWNSFYYQYLDYVAHDDVVFAAGPGIRMGVGGSEPIFFAVGRQSLWLYVLLMFLVHGKVPDIPFSEELRRKVLYARDSDVPLVSAKGKRLELPPQT